MVAGQVPDDSSRQELDALWRATQERLRASVPESTFRLWLEPLRAVGADGDALYLTGPGGNPRLGRAPLLLADRRRRWRPSGAPLRQVSFTSEQAALGGSAIEAAGSS